MKVSRARSIGVLIASNLLGGVGVASGISAGGLLAEQLASTSWAGFAQASSTLGAAIAAVPLATIATNKGRRRALSLGYSIAVVGGLGVVAAAVAGQAVLLLIAMGLFGVAQAVNLQSRYAAAENVSVATRARGMSLVLWATTIGSVMGPNFLDPASTVGEELGLPRYSGPFVISIFAFAAAGIVIALLFKPTPGGADASANIGSDADSSEQSLTALGALGWAAGHPIARFAVILITAAHAVMVMVMVMTPVHMEGNGDSLRIVGLTISLHILGMYGLSPVFGWAIDRLGAGVVALVGIALEAGALIVGFVAAGGNTPLMVTALILLGLGWSAAILAGSALLATVSPPPIRVPLQGASDALMNFAGAGVAALAGPLLALGGFPLVNVAAAVVLAPAAILYFGAIRGAKNLNGLAQK